MRLAATGFVLAACAALPLWALGSPPSTPDAITPDGARYVGEIRNGVMHGTGRAEWPGGKVYVGGFADGMFSGQGDLTLENGDRYVGQFLKGRYHG
ncbi:MAG: peptidase C13, partial [Betaproteobacteria bacterium]|nr:peptidase C13 [Betaproteobacteria bacterium]